MMPTLLRSRHPPPAGAEATTTLPSQPSATSVLVPRSMSRKEAFLVEVDRGSIDARPSGELSEAEAGGTDERPLFRYEATSLEAGQAVGFSFSSSRVSWSQRAGVLLVCSVAAGAAGFVVWRRRLPGRSSPL